jgi:hypothetical protein
MNFKKYQHIERLGSDLVDGLTDGLCYIFPKLDGTNCSVWMGDDGEIHYGSSKRELTLDDGHRGFCRWVEENKDTFKRLFTKYPEINTIYGEWLVSHNVTTYLDNAWKRFYVFDMYTDVQEYEYYEYSFYTSVCEQFGLDYIPYIGINYNTTQEYLKEKLEENNYLIDTQKYPDARGEGIVIKNYDFVNKYGDTVWGKMVRSEFKNNNRNKRTKEEPNGYSIEFEIAHKYITQAFVEKEKAKIEEQNGGWTSKMIPQLLGVIWHEFVTEETWNFIKKFKNPKIDFRELNHQVVAVTKERLPEVF